MSKFDELARSNEVIKQSFLALMTNDPQEAAEYYEKKKGHAPTVLLVRPDFVLSKKHPLVVRYKYAAWGVISVSHLVKPSEVEQDASPAVVFRSREEITPPANAQIDYSFPSVKVGRPEKHKATCPHCHGYILDFNTIGFWYGWAFGITPPYWEELRLWVFRRDGHKCQSCHKVFPPALLQAHHIQAKEEGGEDGARNLTTLCETCHLDTKPIYEE